MTDEEEPFLEELDGAISMLAVTLAALRSARAKLRRLPIDVRNEVTENPSRKRWNQSEEAKKKISDAKKAWHAKKKSLPAASDFQSSEMPPGTAGTAQTRKPDSEDPKAESAS